MERVPLLLLLEGLLLGCSGRRGAAGRHLLQLALLLQVLPLLHPVLEPGVVGLAHLGILGASGQLPPLFEGAVDLCGQKGEGQRGYKGMGCLVPNSRALPAVGKK